MRLSATRAGAPSGHSGEDREQASSLSLGKNKKVPRARERRGGNPHTLITEPRPKNVQELRVRRLLKTVSF